MFDTSLILDYEGFLELGEASQISLLFVALGIFMIFFSLYIWVRAVLIQKINTNVKADILITDGVYGTVRNPVYTAFIFIFTGILLFAKNYFLLTLPIISWVFLTILMKASEEKYLKAKFGKEYDLYCRRVNRVIPWFLKK